MRSAAAPFSFLGVLILIAPAIGMPLSLPPAPELVLFPPAAERALVAVVHERPLAPAVRVLSQVPVAAARGSIPAPTLTLAAAAPVPAPAPATAAAGVVGLERRTHRVQVGDNLWAISRQYGVSTQAVAEANSLTPTSALRVGRELTIPAPGAVHPQAVAAPPRPGSRMASTSGPTATHVVEPGDTLWNIASRYGTTVEDVVARNDLDESALIKPGQRLVISGRALPRHREVAAQARSHPGSRRSEPEMADTLTLRAAGAFLWPSRGVLTSRFGLRRYRRHHDGIDLAAPRGTPIFASRDGVVEFAGRQNGFGLVVFLDHGDGLVTVYGHASRLVVATGQTVKKGQVIALVGCTGRCTGSHLHFEVRVRGRAQNPLEYF